MYVCMSEAPEHVCMYVSFKPTKSACFGGCQIPHEKRSVFDHQFNFLRFVRGGTSRSLARRQTCMYVCMFELQTYPKHVCMYVWQAQASMYVCLRPSEHVCMYVPGSWACMYVCLRLLSKYVCMSQATERVCMLRAERVCMFQVCMYVSESEDLCMYGCLRHTYIVKRVEHVCLVC